jgi:hypothetical protein
VCLEVNPVGKPDAVAPHVRFDERGWETESRQVGLRRCIERDANSHRKPKTTAPIFDFTGSGDKPFDSHIGEKGPVQHPYESGHMEYHNVALTINIIDYF